MTHDELAQIVDENPSGKCDPVMRVSDFLNPLAGPDKPRRPPSRPYEEIP
jgi:hypothetical protein